jgi:hypothetical protein
LLTTLAGDFLPARHALLRRRSLALFSAPGIHRDDAGGAQFSGFFDQPLETVELDERGEKRDLWRWRVRGERLEDAERHALGGDG